MIAGPDLRSQAMAITAKAEDFSYERWQALAKVDLNPTYKTSCEVLAQLKELHGWAVEDE